MFELLDQYQVKEQHVRDDIASGLKAFTAIHITQLGPALGGCRFIEYQDETHAAEGVISLARHKLNLENSESENFHKVSAA